MENKFNSGDKVLVSGIKWDAKKGSLPDSVEIELTADCETDDDIIDILTNHYEYCVIAVESIEIQ